MSRKRRKTKMKTLIDICIPVHGQLELLEKCLESIPDAAGDLRWGVDTHFGAVCANEAYNANTDVIALNQTTLTQDEIECLDITAALTGATGSDLVGLEFRRDADGTDTIEAKVHYIGVVLIAPT